MAATRWCWLAYLHTSQCRPLGVGVSIHHCAVSRCHDVEEQSCLLAPLLYLSTMCGLGTPVHKLPTPRAASWLPEHTCHVLAPPHSGLGSPLCSCAMFQYHHVAAWACVLTHVPSFNTNTLRCRHNCGVCGIGMHDLTPAVYKLWHLMARTPVFVGKTSGGTCLLARL